VKASIACWSITRRPATGCAKFATTFMPALGARVERYTGSRPIFDLHAGR
jgi:hypothetical protein